MRRISIAQEIQRYRRRAARWRACARSPRPISATAFSRASIISQQAAASASGPIPTSRSSAPGELKQFEYSQRLKHRARNVLAAARGPVDRAQPLREGAGRRSAGSRTARRAPSPRGIAPISSCSTRSHPDLAAVSGDRWLDSYVFVAGKAAIDTVFVAGKPVVSNGRHVAREAIRARYRRAMARILA